MNEKKKFSLWFIRLSDLQKKAIAKSDASLNTGRAVENGRKEILSLRVDRV